VSHSIVNSSTAPIQNVALCLSALKRSMGRSHHLPGLVCFYGPSGYGKSFGAAYVADHCRAHYVEAKSSWTKKALLLAILQEMRISPAKTLYEMTDQVAEQLVHSQRPLIIDEVDHIADKGYIEILRDIYEGSNAALLLIGEEHLPAKLRKWERFHGRVLDWVPAQPADIKDAQALRQLYCGEVKIGDDLLARIVEVSRGSVRRVCVNLERVQSEAMLDGRDSIDLNVWGKRELFTGEAPVRRIV